MNEMKESEKYGRDYFSKLSGDIFSQVFKEEFDLIMKFLPPEKGDIILDLGCGKCRAGLFVLNQEKDCDVTLCDVTPTAGGYLQGYKFVECSMEQTPFKNNTFNKIYSLSTISHIDDIDKAIKEIYRISNGEVLITTNNKWNVFILKSASFFGFIPKLKYDETAKKLYNRFTLQKLFKRNGWKIKTIRHYGEYPSSRLPFTFLKNRLMLVVSK